MGNLLHHHPRAEPLEPLDDFADILMRLVLEEHMDMFTGHLPGTDVHLVFDRELPQHVPRSDSNLPGQHPRAILGNLEQMHLQVRLRMCPYLVTSHGDTYYLHFA